MNSLVFVESAEGKIKKSSLEAVAYAKAMGTAVTAIAHIELVTVNRANHIADCINITVLKVPASMRTLCSKSEQFFIVKSDTNIFTVHLETQNFSCGNKVQFVAGGRNFIPFIFFFAHLLINELRFIRVPDTV